jgi:Ni/Co efflux regulator RcnB
MKKLILATIAASLIAGPLAVSAADAAPYQERETTVVRHRPDGRTVVTERTVVRPQYRAWHKGDRFDRRYARDYREIDYRQYRGLRAPPRGYRYVRSGNDAVLVGITSGVIAAVVAGAIR